MPLVVVMSLMFFWNLCRNINDVLIPHLKRSYWLTDLQSSLVQSAFFGAYFLMALPAGIYIRKKGYKRGMVTGLLLASLGAAMFYPAAEVRYYPLFLFALFVMATGFTFLEVTATPYISRLGEPAEASSRLSLSAAAGSVGATIAPYIGSMALLHKKDISAAEMAAYSDDRLRAFLSGEANMVKGPYLSLALLFVVMAIGLCFVKLPAIRNDDPGLELVGKKRPMGNILGFPHALLGALAVFCYVGAEVGIVSFMIRYAKSQRLPGLGEQKSALFISLFMGLVLAGRVCGAWLLKKGAANRILFVSAGGAFLLVAGAMLVHGFPSILALAVVGLFTSVMYPLIFTLSIEGLGSYTKIASSLLIMGVVGGAVVPPVMGFISDMAGIRLAYIAPLACYLYVVFYAVKGYAIKNMAKPKHLKLEV